MSAVLPAKGKRVLLIGSGGQDGRLLADAVRRDEGTVLAVDRGVGADIFDPPSIAAAIAAFAPEELYFLAAYHHSAEDAQGAPADLYAKSFGVHVTGLINVLEALLQHAPGCRVFYAASSHVFAASGTTSQDESTAFAPRDAYGITKVAGVYACRAYRQRGLGISVGYLYNHESHLRPAGFVSQRIVRGARAARAAVDSGQPYVLKLGNLEAIVDWGYAIDYVDAMRRILAHSVADDYVVASGKPHTVGDFVRIAFDAVGLSWQPYVQEDSTLLQKSSTHLVGNSEKLARVLGWRPTVDFESMVRELVRSDAGIVSPLT